jgi:hypothetical protein
VAASQQPRFFDFAQPVSTRPRREFFSNNNNRIQVAGSPLNEFEGFSHELRSLYVSGRLGLSSKMCQRLVELLALQRGWDGGMAMPFKPEEAAHTVSLLIMLNSTLPRFNEPFLAPTIAGFAQLEWHNKQRTLEFEGTSDAWSIVGSETKMRGERVYHQADVSRSDIEELVAAYRWFDGAELLWPII